MKKSIKLTLGLALMMGANPALATEESIPPQLLAHYKQQVQEFCSQEGRGKAETSDALYGNLKGIPLTQSIFTAMAGAYPMTSDQHKRALFGAVFNSESGLLQFVLANFDTYFKAVPKGFFGNYIDSNPDWFRGNYREKEGILKVWLEKRKTPEDKKLEEQHRLEKEQKERDEKARKDKKEAERQDQLKEMYGTGGNNTSAAVASAEVKISVLCKTGGNINDFQPLWIQLSNQHSGGWKEVQAPVKGGYGDPTYWIKPNTAIFLTISHTYFNGKEHIFKGQLVAVGATRPVQQGTRKETGGGYGAGNSFQYNVPNYVTETQSSIENVKKMIGEFSLWRHEKPLELSTGQVIGSWQQVKIKNPYEVDSKNQTLFLWLQVGQTTEVLDFS